MSSQIHIFINSVSQIIFFLVDISTIAYFFIIFVKKKKNFVKMGLYLSNGTVFVKKAGITCMLMTSSEQEKHLLIQIELLRSKAVFVLNISAKFK